MLNRRLLGATAVIAVGAGMISGTQVGFVQPAHAESETAWMYHSEGYNTRSFKPFWELKRKKRKSSYSRKQRLGAGTRAANQERRHRRKRDEAADDSQPKQLLEGGPRPDISPVRPSTVAFRSNHGRGTIVIDTSQRKLFYVLSKTSAYQYPISVGREGFQWTGTNKISRVQNWPDWHPPKEMRERQPNLPVKMTGGLYNPLGAKALYLGSTLYRIHGTNNKGSIGRAASSGCFRMLNGHVTHLASIARVGTKVVVVSSLGKNSVATASRAKSRNDDDDDDDDKDEG